MATKKKNWDSVFKAYPEAEEIYVCDGQPFMTKKAAEQHKRSTKKPIQTIKRKLSAAEKKAAAAAKKAAELAAKEAAELAKKKAEGGADPEE